jgi:sodium pump decarboxylase gamma subunit
VTPLLQSGLEITAIGMSVVFVMLIMLVGIIRGMSAIAMRIDSVATKSIGVGGHAEINDDELITVITAAVAAYRKNRQQ